MQNESVIKYVGFMKNMFDTEFVVGKDEYCFYFGPFLSPNLAYLIEYNSVPATITEQFERLQTSKIYQKDLKEECQKKLKYYKETAHKNEEGKWLLEHQTHAPVSGTLTFDVSTTVAELEDYINKN